MTYFIYHFQQINVVNLYSGRLSHVKKDVIGAPAKAVLLNLLLS